MSVDGKPKSGRPKGKKKKKTGTTDVQFIKIKQRVADRVITTFSLVLNTIYFLQFHFSFWKLHKF